MKIKVCGIRNQNNLSFLNDSDVDLIGFIFYKKSSRNFSNGDIETIDSKKLKVGVFVNQELSEVERLAKKHKLDYLQLHGDESVEYCHELKNKGYKLFKAFSVYDQLPIILKDYKQAVDFFLFDTKGAAYGGNGMQFDWRILSDYQLDKPFILSGGIGPQDVESIKNISHPKLFAVDVNSRFEIAPGLKDEQVLKEFIEELKK